MSDEANKHGEDIFGDAWLLARGVTDLPETKPSYSQLQAAAHRVIFGPIPEEQRKQSAVWENEVMAWRKWALLELGESGREHQQADDGLLRRRLTEAMGK